MSAVIPKALFEVRNNAGFEYDFMVVMKQYSHLHWYSNKSVSKILVFYGVQHNPSGIIHKELQLILLTQLWTVRIWLNWLIKLCIQILSLYSSSCHFCYVLTRLIYVYIYIYICSSIRSSTSRNKVSSTQRQNCCGKTAYPTVTSKIDKIRHWKLWNTARFITAQS